MNSWSVVLFLGKIMDKLSAIVVHRKHAKFSCTISIFIMLVHIICSSNIGNLFTFSACLLAIYLHVSAFIHCHDVNSCCCCLFC